MLSDAQQYGRLVQSSFYGYCAMLPGVIHRLYESHDDPAVSAASRERARVALNFLEAKPVRWPIFNNMAHLLRYFKPDLETAKALTCAVSLAQRVAIKEGSVLWQLLDYARIPEMNPMNSLTPGSVETTPDSRYGGIAQPSSTSWPDTFSASETQYSERSSTYFPEAFTETLEPVGVWSPFLRNDDSALFM